MFRLDGVISTNMDKWLYEWYGIEAVSPADIENWLADNDEDRTLYINSYGGDTMAASQIYTSLARHGGITAVIDGFACSAASYVPLGCKTVKISPTGQIMIHNVWTSCSGDYRDMINMSNELITANTSIKNAYRLKTGLSDDELQRYMDKDSWFDAYEAKKLGFVDEILFTVGESELPQSLLKAMNLQFRAMYAAFNIPGIEQIRDAWNRKNQLSDNTGTPNSRLPEMGTKASRQISTPAESLYKRLFLISH